MIGICTDSSSQMPPELRERYGIEVVPMTVSIDGDEYLEDVDLDADAFWARFDNGRVPEVETSRPSPGQFALAYEALVDRGATGILSIHVGSAVSGTVNSARLAAHSSSVPVRLIDTGTASFGISCCAWAAAQAIVDGASIDDAVAVAEATIPRIGNVFVLGALDLLHAWGRTTISVDDLPAGSIPVLTLDDGDVRPLVIVGSPDEAVAAMVEHITRLGADLKVGVGTADRRGAPISEALAAALHAAPGVLEVVDYRVGPSVGIHTGPGTAGAFAFSAAPLASSVSKAS
ncbi:MAG: DegV family protein [Acidimicrobiia bacterium]